MHVQDSPVFDRDYVSKSVLEEILIEERFPEIESLTEYLKGPLFAVINHNARMRSPYCQPDMESELYFSCSLMSANTCTCRLFIPSPSHNFGCVPSEVSGWLSYLWTAKLWHFSGQFERWIKTSTRSICSKEPIPYSKVPSPSAKTRSGETCSVVILIKTGPWRSLRMN